MPREFSHQKSDFPGESARISLEEMLEKVEFATDLVGCETKGGCYDHYLQPFPLMPLNRAELGMVLGDRRSREGSLSEQNAEAQNIGGD